MTRSTKKAKRADDKDETSDEPMGDSNSGEGLNLELEVTQTEEDQIQGKVSVSNRLRESEREIQGLETKTGDSTKQLCHIKTNY